MNIDEELLFITSSKRRMHIIHFLDEVGSARPSEIAKKLSLLPSAVSKMTKQLKEHNLISEVKYSRFKSLSLTEKGKKIAKEIECYYGPNEE